MNWGWEVSPRSRQAQLATRGEIPRVLDGCYVLTDKGSGDAAISAVHALRIVGGTAALYRELARAERADGPWDAAPPVPGGADPEPTRAVHLALAQRVDDPSAGFLRASAAWASGQLADLLFPVIHVGTWEADFRYVYALGRNSDPDKQTLLRRDLQTGEQTSVALGFGRRATGPTFVSAGRPPRSEEDGYVLTLVYDAVRHQSDLLIFHATGLAHAPLASARLPSGIRAAQPGVWVPADEVANVPRA